MSIQHKIYPVSDKLCVLCAQQWEGECRAYQVPHSLEERARREGDSQGLCQLRVLRWLYDARHPERRIPVVEVAR